MQFEEFDKKIKEAAENHHPAYDEQAWAKMNKLLDKHMPEKEERRRRFAWLFFLLFLAGGAGVFYGVQSLVSSNSAVPSFSSSRNGSGELVPDIAKDKNLPVIKDQEGTVSRISTGSSRENNSSDELANQEAKNLNERGSAKMKNPGTITGDLSATRKSGNNPVTGNKVPAGQHAPADPSFTSGIAKKKKKGTGVPAEVNSGVRVDDQADKQPIPANNNLIIASQTPAPDKIALQSITDTISGQPVAVISGAPQLTDTISKSDAGTTADVPLTQEKKQSPVKQSRFFLTLSAGPDVSFTANGKPGQLIPVTGIGIGYIFRDRFSLRAGFYNADKKYTASPSAYNAPASFYNYYPYLVKVDADCRVYEIPVSLGYHFGARKNHSWFASATLSSYLMKRETYNYSYKTSAWGTVQQREWSLYNSNQHLFSVLGISGGYQRKITNRISFIAEPYLRMPVSGVGYGKVKLNSAGVLFSLAVEPAAFMLRKQKK